jgi:hypothetical protein
MVAGAGLARNASFLKKKEAKYFFDFGAGSFERPRPEFKKSLFYRVHLIFRYLAGSMTRKLSVT